MPKFHPNTIIQDCWSSIGNITFYHQNGHCYYKRKARPVFPGTPAQLDQAHIRYRLIDEVTGYRYNWHKLSSNN